jgi:hypothetical protein
MMAGVTAALTLFKKDRANVKTKNKPIAKNSLVLENQRCCHDKELGIVLYA